MPPSRAEYFVDSDVEAPPNVVYRCPPRWYGADHGPWTGTAINTGEVVTMWPPVTYAFPGLPTAGASDYPNMAGIPRGIYIPSFATTNRGRSAEGFMTFICRTWVNGQNPIDGTDLYTGSLFLVDAIMHASGGSSGCLQDSELSIILYDPEVDPTPCGTVGGDGGGGGGGGGSGGVGGGTDCEWDYIWIEVNYGEGWEVFWEGYGWVCEETT